MLEPFCYMVDGEERCDSEEAKRLLRIVATLDDRGARFVLVVTEKYVAALARAGPIRLCRAGAGRRAVPAPVAMARAMARGPMCDPGRRRA